MLPWVYHCGLPTNNVISAKELLNWLMARASALLFKGPEFESSSSKINGLDFPIVIGSTLKYAIAYNMI
jgi:hypothetical protein